MDALLGHCLVMSAILGFVCCGDTCRLPADLMSSLKILILTNMVNVLCLYEKKVTYDIIGRLHDRDHGNQIMLNVL